MIRNKYYVPLSEIYRAYDDHKSKNPSNFRFDSDYEDTGVELSGNYHKDADK